MSIEARFRVPRGGFTLDVDLVLPAAGVTAVYGVSGCGKTTLLRALAGLDHHAGGRLRVNGAIWQSERIFTAPHRRSLGYVFQEASLFAHLDVRGNLNYGFARVPAVKRQLSLPQILDLLEIGPLLTRKPATLSGGEQGRVALARALACSPRLLLMDEPLAGLDENRKQDVLPYIQRVQRELNIPIIYVSHSRAEVSQLADFLVLLENGRVAATGEVHEVMTRLDLHWAQDQEAVAIIDAVVDGHDTGYDLTELKFSAGRISVPLLNLPRGTRVRIQLSARDVSLTLARQSDTSILNIFPATVDSLADHGRAQVTVRLLAAGVPLLARVTRKSSHLLGLEPGKLVYAQAKSVALLS